MPRHLAMGDVLGQRARRAPARLAHDAPRRDGGADALLALPAGDRAMRRPDDVLDVPGRDHRLARDGHAAIAVGYAATSLAGGMAVAVAATVVARRRRYG